MRLKRGGMYSEESHGDGGGGERTETVTVVKVFGWLWAEAMMRLSGNEGEVSM